MTSIFVHPTALVESTDIGLGTRIWAYTHVMAGAHIGENCNIGENCFIETGSYIGNNTTVKNGNMVWEGVTVQDGVFVGPNVHLTNDMYPRSPRLPQARERYAEKSRWLEPTLIKTGASLGAGCIVLPGITVGEYAMVAAGAVVTKPVQAYALVRGNPARRVGWVCQCGRPIRSSGNSMSCSGCNRIFSAADEVLFPAHTEV